MQQTRMNKIYGSILAGVGGLLFLLLITSMVTSFFLPAQSGMQPAWSYYLIDLLLLSITALGVYQMRASREPLPLSRQAAIPVGLILGVALAILLYIPGFGVALIFAALGLPWLIGILFMAPASISSISPIFALISVVLYLVFALSYCLCAFRVARRSGSVKQGLWSSVQVALATCLSTVFVFSFIDIVAYFVFHTGSDLVAPSSFPGFSALVNYAASYKGIVQLLMSWLLIPTMISLLLAIPSAFCARRRAVLRTGFIALADEER